MKAIRILRLIRLVRRISALRIVLHALISSSLKLLNVFGFLVLFLYIFSVLGVQLFATTKISGLLDQRLVNFKNVHSGFLILFRSCTGENWHLVMHAFTKERSIDYLCKSDFDYETYIENNFEP